MGEILIEALKVHCIVGLLPFEREEPQEIILDLQMECDINDVVQHDALQNSPDYALACDLLSEKIIKERYQTLEALAAGSARLLLERWPSVERIVFTVRKPAAHPSAQSCGVRLILSRSDLS